MLWIPHFVEHDCCCCRRCCSSSSPSLLTLLYKNISISDTTARISTVEAHDAIFGFPIYKHVAKTHYLNACMERIHIKVKQRHHILFYFILHHVNYHGYGSTVEANIVNVFGFILFYFFTFLVFGRKKSRQLKI
jgi:hypothetical protein